MSGRIMAHNGGFGELAKLEDQLGDYRELVQGDTDSERYFALITQQIDAHGGDVGAGIAAAARWIGERLPVSSLNTLNARLTFIARARGGSRRARRAAGLRGRCPAFSRPAG
jgi:hypothetical protein